MSDSPQPGGVRRFGRKDRKERLPPSAPLFPQYQPEKPAPPPDLPEPDFDALIPDHDQEALDALGALPPDSVRHRNILPPEERFPPLPEKAPVAAASPAAPARAIPPVASRKRGRKLLYNLITLLAVLGTFVIVGVYVIIWGEPQSYLNPFPPDVRYVFVTATPGGAAAIDAPTATLEPQATPTFEAPPTPESAFPFVLRGSVVYIANANGRGCEWSSIAGTVVDLNGSALNGYRVRVTGDGFDETVFTGAAQTFGEGGYEMPLGNAPVAADYTIQLFSPQGAPLSDGFPVSTTAECERNVAILSLTQSR